MLTFPRPGRIAGLAIDRNHLGRVMCGLEAIEVSVLGTTLLKAEMLFVESAHWRVVAMPTNVPSSDLLDVFDAIS